MDQQSHKKCVDVTHWLKIHVCLLRQFSIFPGGLKPCRFAVEAESMGVNLPPCYYFLVQIECSGCWKMICLIFDASLVHLSCYCSRKAENNWNELFIPISEIATSHIYKLKKTRNKGDRNLVFFFNQEESEDTMLYILSVKWLSCCSEVGDHEMCKKQVQVTPFYGSYHWLIMILWVGISLK